VIRNEKTYYLEIEESPYDNFNELNAVNLGCAKYPICRRFAAYVGSTRTWHLVGTSLPLFILSTFSSWTFCSDVTPIHWTVIFVFSSLSLLSNLLQLCMKPQIKVIDADHVWELSQRRIQRNFNVYDRYLIDEARLGSSDESEDSNHRDSPLNSQESEFGDEE
jgi:hypothetical protein